MVISWMFFGWVSFVLYLLHLFVIGIVGCRFFVVFYDDGVSYGVVFVVTCVLCVLVCVGVVYVFMWFVDEFGI